MPDRAARRVLDAWIHRIAPVQEDLSRAHWEAACEASADHQDDVARIASVLDRVLHDERGIGKVEQSLAERIDDPVLRRALRRLQLRLLPHRQPRPARLLELEAELPTSFSRFRADVGGERLAAHEVAATLGTCEDHGVLEATWRAAVAIGAELEERVREAARLRNEHARALGLSDFRSLGLLTEETDAAELDTFLRDLEEGTDEPWAESKAQLDEGISARLGLSATALCPWHYGDVFLQSRPPETAESDPFTALDPVALTRRTFEGLGFDVEGMLEASDLFPREGKNQHAFCAHLDRAGDIRVLANVVPSRRWMRTMLHEFGHGVYYQGLEFQLPWNLVKPPHACVTEGVAMLFDRLVHDSLWRESIAGLPADEAAPARARAELLTFVRWGLVVARFEEALYADPDQDLDAVWWGLVERLQGLRRPERAPRGVWAAKIHVACHPVYYHAYLLGQAVASQLRRHIEEGLGSTFVHDPEAGRWLREAVFLPAARDRWDERMARATGAAPTASALLADLLAPERA